MVSRASVQILPWASWPRLKGMSAMGVGGERGVGFGHGLGLALGGGGVGGEAQIEESARESGLGVGVKANGCNGSELCAARSGAGVEVEGAEFAVGAREIPAGGELERQLGAGVFHGAGGRVGRLCRGGFLGLEGERCGKKNQGGKGLKHGLFALIWLN